MTIRMVAVMLLIPLVSCKDQTPPPTPVRGTSPTDPTAVARQVKNRVGDVGDMVNKSQEDLGRMADGMNGVKPGTEAASKERVFSVAGVRFEMPGQGGWSALPASGMRAADLTFKNDDGEAHAVFFAVGGDTASNIARWRGQVQVNPGTTPSETTSETNGLTVTRIEMLGTYAGMTGMGTPGSPEPNTRFIGVVIEGGKGGVQIKFTGPDAVVKAARSAFDGMIENVRRN